MTAQRSNDDESIPVGREQVIKAATEAAAILFSEHQPSQVTVRDIAAAAGVSHALLHRYMGTKEDIFLAALEYDHALIAEKVKEARGMAGVGSPFDDTLPFARYFRTLVRASLDGISVSATDELRSFNDRMMVSLRENPPGAEVLGGPTDIRIRFAAVLGATAAIIAAEDFFLSWAGLDGEDREQTLRELNRLNLRILMLDEPQPE